MKFKTQSDFPVTADFRDDGVMLSCIYDSYDENLDKKVVKERITLTFEELEQIYTEFKKLKEK